MSLKKINRIITLIIALFLGFSAGILSYTQVLHTADQYITNLIYKNNPFEKADSRLTIIAIDKASEELYGDYSTWSRNLLAQAVTELFSQNAAVIGLDMDLSADGTDASGDSALTEACKEAGNVIAMAHAVFDTVSPVKEDEKTKSDNVSDTPDETETPPEAFTPREDTFIPMQNAGVLPVSSPDGHILAPSAVDTSVKWSERKIEDIIYPYSSIRENVTIGITNALQQAVDGTIHEAALAVTYQETEYDSFAVATYKAFQDSQSKEYTLPELDSETLFGFNSIWDTRSYNVISFSDLLSGNYDTSLVQDKIALVGIYEPIDTDSLFQYLRADKQQQEILTEAAVIQALLNQKTIKDVTPLFQALFYGILICLVYLIFSERKRWITFLAQLLILYGLMTGAYCLNLAGYRFLLLTPILTIPLALFLFLLQRLIVNRLERSKMERTLKLYVDSRVVDEITDVSPFALSQVSERRHIAVLFVDIRGFTTLSESLEPEQVVEILNEYLSLVASAVSHWNGTLDKFIGDAAMAIFNAPNDLDDYVFRAVCAADEIVKSADYIRNKYEERFGKTVTFGIGINCGEAIVGNIGCTSRMDYTAIGDTVNTASRLESQAAPGQILVSEAVLNTIAKRVNATFIGSLSLKGKSQTVNAYQIDTIEKPKKSLSDVRKEFFNENRILHSKARTN